MLQVIYLSLFALVSVLVIRNLIANLVAMSRNEMQPPSVRQRKRAIHPELLDEDGNVTEEPLLVIRSANVDDARERLDALYRGESIDDDDLPASV